MAYTANKNGKTRWVSVPLKEELHEEVRVRAVRLRLPWPDVIAEAIALWLTAHTDEAA